MEGTNHGPPEMNGRAPGAPNEGQGAASGGDLPSGRPESPGEGIVDPGASQAASGGDAFASPSDASRGPVDDSGGEGAVVVHPEAAPGSPEGGSGGEVEDEPPPELELGHLAEGAPLANLDACRAHGLTFEDGKFRNRDGQALCGAHPKSPKGPCRSNKLYDNGRCHYHGGPTPRGAASANYVHGRFSKALNPKRRALYEDARGSEDLLSLERTLAMHDVQAVEALERREQLDTPEFRRRALALFRGAKKALAEDPDLASAKLLELQRLLERGTEEDRAREEVSRLTSSLSRRQEAAWKIRLGAAHVINQSELTAILGRFIEVAIQEMPENCVRPFLRRVDREVLRGRLAQQGLDATSP